MPTGTNLEKVTAFEEGTVIDIDVHISGINDPEFMRALSRRFDEPYKSHFDPDVETLPNYPTIGHGEVVPSEVHDELGDVTDPDDLSRGLFEPFGVDKAVVHNVVPLDANADLERFGMEMKAHNDVFIERFLEDQENLYGTASVGVHVLDEAVEEIHRMGKEEKIVGLLIHIGGQERALGDPRYDPLYAAAEENGLPIVFHSTGSSLIWNGAGFSRGINRLVTHNVLGHLWSEMLTLGSVITEGVPEKFPDLNFVMLGPGFGWVPYLMGRINREWHQRRTEVPLLQKLPEEYIRDQFYFGTQPLGEFADPEFFKSLIDIVGPQSLIYGSDFPHYDIDSPSAVNDVLSHVSDEEREQILYKNAVDVFNIPV